VNALADANSVTQDLPGPEQRAEKSGGAAVTDVAGLGLDHTPREPHIPIRSSLSSRRAAHGDRTRFDRYGGGPLGVRALMQPPSRDSSQWQRTRDRLFV